MASLHSLHLRLTALKHAVHPFHVDLANPHVVLDFLHRNACRPETPVFTSHVLKRAASAFYRLAVAEADRGHPDTALNYAIAAKMLLEVHPGDLKAVVRVVNEYYKHIDREPAK